MEGGWLDRRWPTKKLVRVALRKEGGQATIVRGGGRGGENQKVDGELGFRSQLLYT